MSWMWNCLVGTFNKEKALVRNLFHDCEIFANFRLKLYKHLSPSQVARFIFPADWSRLTAPVAQFGDYNIQHISAAAPLAMLLKPQHWTLLAPSVAQPDPKPQEMVGEMSTLRDIWWRVTEAGMQESCTDKLVTRAGNEGPRCFPNHVEGCYNFTT